METVVNSRGSGASGGDHKVLVHRDSTDLQLVWITPHRTTVLPRLQSVDMPGMLQG